MIEASVPSACSDAVTSFWETFAERYFGREPFEVEDPPVDFAVDPELLFELLVRACAGRRSDVKDPYVKFWIGGHQVIADVDVLLPTHGDGSLEGYRARVEASLEDRSWALVVGRLQAVSRRMWKTAAQFVLGLSEATGVVPWYAHVAAIVGRYESTGRGIHQDGPFGVFVSTVDGCKQMLVWPADADVPAESRSYAAAALQARRLRCGPGRMVYWPAEWWHVAESATPSATLHLVVRERPPGLPDLAALCTAPLGDGFEDRALAWGSAPDAVGFPAQYDAALEALVEMCGDRSGMRDRLVADWLRCRTGLGFEALPPRRVAAEPEMSDALIRDGVCPIVLAARDGTTSWCAADGRVGRLRSAPALTELIVRLNDGERVLVGDALARTQEPVERRLLLGAVKLLAGWRAVRIEQGCQ